MVTEDDTYVIDNMGNPEDAPDICLGKFILDGLINNPSDEVITDAHTGESITYAQLLQEICQLAESLRRSGCTPGTLIGLCSENHIKFFIPLLATFAIGAVSVPINPAYTVEELIHVMNLTKPKILFCSKFTVKKFLDNRSKFDYVEKIIVLDPGRIQGAMYLNLFIKSQLGRRIIDPAKFNIFDENPAENLALILPSSGTTGLPKGVMLTHQNIIVRIHQVLQPSPNDPYVPENDPCFLALVPLFHGYGIMLGLGCMLAQFKLIIMKRFVEDLFLQVIQDNKIEKLPLAPPLVVFLAKSPKVEKYDLSCVKQVYSGGAPLKQEVETALLKRLKNVQSIRQGYGLTECLAITIGQYESSHKRGNVGTLTSFAKAKIRDPETGRSLPPNQIGEICVKSLQVMKGYYNNEEATRESFTSDGWLKTGDIGYYDDEGVFFIVDRLKELIKYKGYQVAPAELESILLNHPKILDAGVVGVPDELAGELPLALIVKQPGTQLSERQVQDFVSTKISPQKRLRGGVIFVSAIPRNSAGKIIRRDLKEMVKSIKVHRESKL